MKWTVLLKLLLLLQTDSYVIVNMNGKALVKKDGKPAEVITGSNIKASDSINFISKGVMRLAGNGGTFFIRSGVNADIKNGTTPGVWKVLRNELLPTRISGSMKTRGGLISSEIEAEKTFQLYSDSLLPMLVFDTMLIEVNKDFIKDTTNHFFYLSYVNNGEEINKKIPWFTRSSKLYLAFDRRILLIDGNEPERSEISKSQIYFFKRETLTYTLLSSFCIRFQSFANLQTELCLVAKGLQTSADSYNLNDEQTLALLNYVRAYYGQIDEDEFRLKYLPKLTCHD